MQARRNGFICLILIVLLGGCVSREYKQADQYEKTPWYVISYFSPDTDFKAGEVNVYKLLRRADSPEGKLEGLSTNRRWGEGHSNITRNSGGKIRISVVITSDGIDPDMCLFELSATYTEDEHEFASLSKSSKTDLCEKTEFENPYLSTRNQDESEKWITLNFQVRRGGN